MESIIRAVVLYFTLLVLFRLSGKRTMAQITPFDMILLLLISEAIQNFLVNRDHSFTNALLVVATLIGTDVALSLIKHRSPRLSRLLDDAPVVIVRDGKLLREAGDHERVDEGDVMRAARLHHGIDRMEDIRYAVLETDGQISVIPRTVPA